MKLTFNEFLGLVLTFIILRQFYSAFKGTSLLFENSGGLEPGFGEARAVGELLFTRYIYPLELISILLLVGKSKRSVLPLSSAMMHQINSSIEFKLFLLPERQIVWIRVNHLLSLTIKKLSPVPSAIKPSGSRSKAQLLSPA